MREEIMRAGEYYGIYSHGHLYVDYRLQSGPSLFKTISICLRRNRFRFCSRILLVLFV